MEENDCYFVNSRGVLKSCDFHSPKPISSCGSDNQYLIDMLSSLKMFDGMSIYVCSELLRYFVTKILPRLKNRFVLVSGDSDLCVPIEALNQQQMNYLLSHPYLIHWFVQNTRLQFESKITQLPIGMDFHTLFNNPNHSWKKEGELHFPIEQERILHRIRENARPFQERNRKIYVNFTPISRFNNDRKRALEKIPGYLLDTHLYFMKRTDNWEKIAQHAFVLSPFGNGMDCHRTWETLCLGGIPILCAPHFSKLLEGLPVLNVSDWGEINQELLDATLIKFQDREFQYEKLCLTFWKNKIKKSRIRI